ncbi:MULTISPECIES: hypothetical protein [unclassified Pseudomonas]|uniref:hypothetical protein n=1 Tax=unclassified Pseudomonas TaxID=196821 RepID=UPI001F59FEDC|nr:MULTISPECIES: hypothetical protein [unclassified Pseudomonas]
MSLKLNERYPGRFNNPSAAYPQGSFKNRTSPTAKDGSYLEKDWANDKEGFFQSLLSEAGITPNGVVDSVGSSQFYSAAKQLFNPGRLIGVKVIQTSGTYTPTTGTKFVLARLIGGGAAGSGAAATNASQISVGGGGASGSDLYVLITNPVAMAAVIGAGGLGVLGGTGGAGGSTTLGSLATAPGGLSGGSVAVSSTSTFNGGQPGAAGALPTTTATLITAAKGQPGTLGIVMNGFVFSGNGGSGPFGGGGVGNFNGIGGAGAGPGSGGAGSASPVSSAATAGGKGSDGCIEMWEYS